MQDHFDVAVFDGDGIGPEIMAPTFDILSALVAESGYALRFQPCAAGAAQYGRTGEAFPEASGDSARAADAILLSAMGLPEVRYPDGTEISPQIDLRKALGLFAGVRPVRIFPGQRTPLALPPDCSVDFVLIRESTEGLFHSQGQGHVEADEARETLRITRATSERLFAFAFALARSRKAAEQGPGRVTCVARPMSFAPSPFSARSSTPRRRAIRIWRPITPMWMRRRCAATPTGCATRWRP